MQISGLVFYHKGIRRRQRTKKKYTNINMSMWLDYAEALGTPTETLIGLCWSIVHTHLSLYFGLCWSIVYTYLNFDWTLLKHCVRPHQPWLDYAEALSTPTWTVNVMSVEMMVIGVLSRLSSASATNAVWGSNTLFRSLSTYVVNVTMLTCQNQ